MKNKESLDIPPVFTPEVVDAVADNAEALKAIKSILTSGDEAMALNDCGSNGCCPPCCCPKFLKFKIIGCTVIIINDNAECQKPWNSTSDTENNEN